jgi:maltoporin
MMTRPLTILRGIRPTILAVLGIAWTLSSPGRLEAAPDQEVTDKPTSNQSTPEAGTRTAQAEQPAEEQPPAEEAAPADPAAEPAAGEPAPGEPPQTEQTDAPAEEPKAMPMPADTPKVGDVSMHGYFRAGYGVSSEKGRQVCFQVNGAASKYRLGNECDLYGEWLFSAPAYVGSDGVIANANIMFNLYVPTTPLGYPDSLTPQGGAVGQGVHWGFNQFFFDFKGLPFLPTGTVAWVGRRFYKREDVHVTDFFWWNASGLGGGIEDIPVSETMKVSYAAFVVDGPGISAGPPAPALPARTDIAIRNDLRLYGIPVHKDGELVLGVSAIADVSDNVNTESGFSGTVMHVFNGIMGGGNKLSFQYGMGPGIGLGGSDSLLTSTDTSRIRAVENLTIQPTEEVGAQFTAVYQHDKLDAPAGSPDKQDWISAGGRISYAVHPYVQLLGEVGFDTVKPDGGDRRNLTKISFAPVIAAGKGYWARPQLRLFATIAFWNDAARLAGVDSGGIYTDTDKTSGATFGMQSESWW